MSDPPSTPLHPTREAWLLALTEEVRPWFMGELPPIVRLSVGFTSKGMRSTRVGECWSTKKRDPKRPPQIFIHPGQTDPLKVAAIVCHELIHAARPGVKHGAKFKEMALLIGLEGRMTATRPGDEFKFMIQEMLKTVGPFPHEAPTAEESSTGPKQSTRMLKMECQECGYLCRAAKKWVEVGVPECPACRVGLVVEMPEEEAA